jgi:hypothetical protein
VNGGYPGSRLPRVPAAVSGGKRADVAEAIPTLDEARKRLGVFAARSKSWLAPAVIESPDDVPERIGPEIYRKP